MSPGQYDHGAVPVLEGRQPPIRKEIEDTPFHPFFSPLFYRRSTLYTAIPSPRSRKRGNTLGCAIATHCRNFVSDFLDPLFVIATLIGHVWCDRQVTVTVGHYRPYHWLR